MKQATATKKFEENLGVLNAAHFYHLIELNWSQNQPIRTDHFRAKY